MADKTFDQPNWKPLEHLVGPEGCGQFMWMWQEKGSEFYKHICTRRYLLLDSAGRCYQRGPNGLMPADVHAELKRVTE
ncbi:MAG: hypothetical protein ABSF45_31325 [Terriglobia bacterium]|jgi:hypothetical protein